MAEATVMLAGKRDDVADADFPWVRPPNSGSSTNVPQRPGAGWLRPNGAALLSYSKSPVLLRQQPPFFQNDFRWCSGSLSREEGKWETSWRAWASSFLIAESGCKANQEAQSSNHGKLFLCLLPSMWRRKQHCLIPTVFELFSCGLLFPGGERSISRSWLSTRVSIYRIGICAAWFWTTSRPSH